MWNRARDWGKVAVRSLACPPLSFLRISIDWMDHELWTPRFSPLVPGPGLRRYCDVRVSLPAPVNVPPHLCFFFPFYFLPLLCSTLSVFSRAMKAYLLVGSTDPTLRCIVSSIVKLFASAHESRLLSGKRHRWIWPRHRDCTSHTARALPVLGTNRMVVSDCLLISPSPALCSAYVVN